MLIVQLTESFSQCFSRLILPECSTNSILDWVDHVHVSVSLVSSHFSTSVLFDYMVKINILNLQSVVARGWCDNYFFLPFRPLIVCRIASHSLRFLLEIFPELSVTCTSNHWLLFVSWLLSHWKEYGLWGNVLHRIGNQVMVFTTDISIKKTLMPSTKENASWENLFYCSKFNHVWPQLPHIIRLGQISGCPFEAVCLYNTNWLIMTTGPVHEAEKARW